MSTPILHDDAEIIEAPAIDPAKAKAQLLSVLHKIDPLICGREAAEALAKRNRELLDGDSQAIREALADQVALLEAMACRYAFESLASKGKIEREKAHANLSLKAHATMVQVLMALHRVTQDQKDDAAIEV